MNKTSDVLSLKVLAAYARDVGQGVARIDHSSMDSLGVSTGDTIEVVGKKDGVDAKCYPLLPSDEGQGITRIDPEIREVIGAVIDDIVTLRKTTAVPAENFGLKTEGPEGGHDKDSLAQPSVPAKTEASELMDKMEADSPLMIIFSGSSLNFEKEWNRIMEFIGMLEAATRTKSKCKCYSDGEKALGWDFFKLEIDQEFAAKLHDLYPDIKKQEAGTPEERLALWMNKQLKKMKMDFRLKLSEVPQEEVKGFRLNPEYYRDKMDADDLR